MSEDRPKVGVGVLVVKEGKILLGKRKNSHGDGSWALPGGHLEFGESLEDCAKREVAEEVGIVIKNIKKLAFTNDILPQAGKHYITCHLRADYDSGEVRNLEPKKCEGWGWFDWDNLPTPLSTWTQSLLKENIDPLV